MSSITSTDFVKSADAAKPVRKLTRVKNFSGNEEALAAFNSMKECYMVLCGDSDVQADGTAFQADLGEGKSIFLELTLDVVVV